MSAGLYFSIFEIVWTFEVAAAACASYAAINLLRPAIETKSGSRLPANYRTL
jgi:hypothetical protein